MRLLSLLQQLFLKQEQGWEMYVPPSSPLVPALFSETLAQTISLVWSVATNVQ